MDRMMVMSQPNQLLFNLNPTLKPPPLPARFHPPQPIVINKFDTVSHFLLFAVAVGETLIFEN